MDNPKDSNTDLFSKVKDAFQELELDQKAAFIVTETINTAVEALTTVADKVSEEVSQFFTSAESDTPESDEDPSEDQKS